MRTPPRESDAMVSNHCCKFFPRVQRVSWHVLLQGDDNWHTRVKRANKAQDVPKRDLMFKEPSRLLPHKCLSRSSQGKT